MIPKALNPLRLLAHKVKNVAYTVFSWLGFKYNLQVYDDEFYVGNQEEGLRMAEWFVPLLKDIFKFKSLIDIGCGTGHYLSFCKKLGVEDVFGIEGSPAAFKHLLVARDLVIHHDLRTPYKFGRRWDLCISIEVAEHIDLVDTDNYVKILCDAADVVIITAAPLGQGGTRHINEHPKEWWIKRFSLRGYQYDKDATDKMLAGIVHAKTKSKHVAPWFETNLMVFRRDAVSN